MISVNWNQMSRQVADLAKSYEELPRHIGKKHMMASVRRALKAAGGVQRLRANTPPVNTRRGRRKKGEKKRSTGELRRSVTTKAKWYGSGKNGTAVAILGYKAGWPSVKAYWHEFGTKRMQGVAMMQRTYESIRGQVAARLADELRDSLEKAANEVGGGKNQGYQG